MNKGLKRLRSELGPIDPNRYWGRAPRKRCPQCGRKIRGSSHSVGH